MLFASRGGGGGGWSGGKGKGGVGLMHVDSSYFQFFIFLNTFCCCLLSFFFSNQSTTVSVAAPCGTSCDENVFLEQLQQSGVCHFRR